MGDNRNDMEALACEGRCLRWAIVALIAIVTVGLADRLLPLLSLWYFLMVPAVFIGTHCFLEWITPTKARHNHAPLNRNERGVERETPFTLE
jgi:hypothetical protein